MKQWKRNLRDLLEVLIFFVILIAVLGMISLAGGFLLYWLFHWIFMT